MLEQMKVRAGGDVCAPMLWVLLSLLPGLVPCRPRSWAVREASMMPTVAGMLCTRRTSCRRTPPRAMRGRVTRTARAPAEQVSFACMPLYAMLPALTEFCVEQGWTVAYTRWVLGLGYHARGARSAAGCRCQAACSGRVCGAAMSARAAKPSC